MAGLRTLQDKLYAHGLLLASLPFTRLSAAPRHGLGDSPEHDLVSNVHRAAYKARSNRQIKPAIGSVMQGRNFNGVPHSENTGRSLGESCSLKTLD